MLSIEFLIWKDGEIEADGTVSTNYVGGQLLKVTSNGRLAICLAPNTDPVAGWAQNDREIDIANGSSTYVKLGKAQLFGSTQSDGTVVYPFNNSLTYAAGELLYVNGTTGQLQNITGGSDSKAVAIVVAVGTQYIGVTGNYLRIISLI
jgi:hypothetical protein